ncbi:MAG: SDR family NAD(P)-dependent oxidoreductase [Dehalococcoidales bacterium]|nr:SDR family NAD(P)-dependent oxidoreductase [Dehalococcoidales bacterium]
MENVEEKVAFITGGASGIGLGIAKVFARNGMKVVIADSRQDALDEAMGYFKETGEPVHPIRLDVTDREAYVRAADEAEKIFEKIHVLVNNAGVASGGPFGKITFNDWDYSISVNITGVVNGLVIILPRIQAHGEGGHVIATSSTAGLAAVNGNIIYNTTKYAVCAMMETLAGDLDGTGVGASVLIPGPTTTNLGPSSFANRPEHLKNEGQEWPPRPPQPKDGEAPRRPMFDTSVFMDPVETGERVLRGIKRNDIFIHTHSEFREGYIARHEAVIRAIPDEPRNEKRWEIVKNFGTLIYNPVYERQTTPGPPDWNTD